MKRSSVVGESNAAFSSVVAVVVVVVLAAVVAMVLMLLFFFVAPLFGRQVITPEITFTPLDERGVWQPRSCLGLQWRCLGRP